MYVYTYAYIYQRYTACMTVPNHVLKNIMNAPSTRAIHTYIPSYIHT